MSSPPQVTSSSWAMIAVLGVTWGGTFLVIELALQGMTPFWLAAGRIGFAAVLMLTIWAGRGFALFATAVSRSAWTSVCVLGLLSAAMPFILLSWGQQFVTSGFAGVSMASVSLMVLPLAHFLVPGERLSLRKCAGFILGFVGVCLLIGSQAFETSGAAQEAPGRIACFLAALCYAVSSVLLRRLPSVDPVGLAAVLFLLGTVVVVPAAFLVEGPPPRPDTTTLLLIGFLGLVPTAAANLMRILVVRSAGPVFMSLVGYQVPVWSVVLGAAILSEPLPPDLLWAMVLILGGMGLSQYGALKRLFLGS